MTIRDIVQQWHRDTFHGSAIGRELSAEGHGRMFDAVNDLVGRLEKAGRTSPAPAPDAPAQ